METLGIGNCSSIYEFSPLVYQLLHIGRPLAREIHLFSRPRVYEAKRLVMKCLTRTQFETVLYESLI